MGIPRADGFYGKCDPNNKKMSELDLLCENNYSNILIDTSQI